MRGPREVVRQLVLVTSVVGLVTGLVGLAAVRHQEREEVLESAADAGLASAERNASIIDGRVEALLAQLSLLATRDKVTGLTEEASGELEVALRAADQIEEFVLHDASGRPVAAASSSRMLTVEQAEPRGRVDPAQPDPHARVDLEGDRAALELTVPVVLPSARIVGALVGRTQLGVVTPEVQRTPRPGGRLSIVDPDGITVADRDLQRVTDRYLQPIGDLPPDRAVTRAEAPDGAALVSAAPLGTVDAWVVLEQLESDVIGIVGVRLLGPTGVLLAVVLAIVLAVIVTSRRLLRPLGSLADGVGRLAAGEAAVRVEEEGSGEVADLARGFNQMAAALEQRRRELERTERSARLSEERLRLVVDGVEGYAIVLLDLLGDVRSWNEGARRVTGRSEDDMLGRRLTDLAARDEPMPDPLLEATRTGRGEAEGWFLRPDGSRFWGELTVTALRRDDGAPSGYAAILQDVTERRAARRALEAALHREQQAAGELRRANELKDEFLAVAAHEIRTPLSAILGATQVLAPGPFALDATETEEVRQLILRHANDMHGIVERLLDFTHLQAGRVRIAPRRIELRTELQQVVDGLGHDLEEHHVTLHAEPVAVEVDPDLLRHVVGNLLSNATKFSPPDTTVTIDAGVRDGTLTIAVTDEGPGIDPEDQDRIFELFRQSTRSVPSARGTGVGLTIVRRYLDLVGGDVVVDSELGRGATFRVQVPVRPPQAGTTATPHGSGSSVR